MFEWLSSNTRKSITPEQGRLYLLRCGFYPIELDVLTDAALVDFALLVSGHDSAEEQTNPEDWQRWTYAVAKNILFNHIKARMHTQTAADVPTDSEVNKLLGAFFKESAKFNYEERLQFFDFDSRYVGHDADSPPRAKFIDWKALVTSPRPRPAAPVPEPEQQPRTSSGMKIFRGVALALVVGVAIAASLPVTGPAIGAAALAAGAWITMGALAGLAAKAVGFAVAAVATGLVVASVEIARKVKNSRAQRAASQREPVSAPEAAAAPAPARDELAADMDAFERLENGGSPAVVQAALAASSASVRSVTPPPRQPSPDEGLLARSMLKVVGSGAYAVGRGLQIAGQAYHALPGFRSRSQTR